MDLVNYMGFGLTVSGEPRRAGNIERFLLASFFVFIIVAGSASQARADSLFEALVSAYVANPALNAARAGVRATDEEVPRAHSGWRPTIAGTGSVTYSDENNDPGLVSDGDVTTKSYAVSLRQPIFRGFRTINSIREAEASVRAARQQLKGTEQLTLLNAVTAYMNVVRDQSIVRYRQSNVGVLSEQLSATRERFNVNLVTKTDVAQSEARRSRAMSDLSLAQGNLKTSRATYKRVVGNSPTNLRQPGNLSHILPNSLDAAILVGMEENPDIIAAIFRAKAQRHAVDVVRGELLPEINLEASYGKSYDPETYIEENEVTTVTGRLTVPLYQAGEVSARIRQSKHLYEQRRGELDDVRDRIRAEIVSAWSQLESAKAQLASDRAQVSANQTALSGVRSEEKVGQRTVLDVLDAEQELVNSQVRLQTTQRDVVIATFSVLSAVGRLTAMDLGLPVEYYDPEAHYQKVRRKWFGTGPRLPRGDESERLN